MTIYLFIYLCFEFYQNKLHKGINLIGFFYLVAYCNGMKFVKYININAFILMCLVDISNNF
jgi:hypothetical protein